MARIIEICGAPGVGKSTIFAEINRQRSRKENWTTASITNPYGEESMAGFMKRIFKVATELSGDSNFNFSESMLLRARRVVRELRKGKNYVDLIALKEAGDRFVATYPEYIEACWKNIYYKQKKSSNGLDLRFEKAEFIYRIIKKIQIINEKKSDKSVIIDEGLINLVDRVLYKSTNDLNETEEIRGLLGKMPLPAALVYIEADLEENAHRLLSRNDLRDMHKGLDKEELEDFTESCRKRIKKTIKMLKDKGKPVLYLDSTDPVELNANKIIEFAYNMSLREPVVMAQEALIQ